MRVRGGVRVRVRVALRVEREGVDAGEGRLSAGQRFFDFLLWPWLGRYGWFAYGAASLAGAGVAVYVFDPEGGWTPTLFTWLYRIGFSGFLLGAGPVFALFILDASSIESAQMASTWVRLFIGSLEIIVFTLITQVIEGRPEAGCRALCGPRTCRCCIMGFWGSDQFKKHWFRRLCMRFSSVSLTVYIVQEFHFNLTSAILNALGGFAPPFCNQGIYPDYSACHVAAHTGDKITMNVGTAIILYPVCNLLFWFALLYGWERVNYVGSFEWMIGKLITLAKGGGGGGGGRRNKNPKNTDETGNNDSESGGGGGGHGLKVAASSRGRVGCRAACSGGRRPCCCVLPPSQWCCGECHREPAAGDISPVVMSINDWSTGPLRRWAIAATTIMAVMIGGLIIGANVL